MASAHNDPKLLYAIPGVSAYHIANGTEASLTPAGPQTLSLLMVPTASPFADLSLSDSQTGGSGSNGHARSSSGDTGINSQASLTAQHEEDFYLHLHLPPELDLPLPATTQIYHQPPTSYLIPRWDLGRNSGVFTRIEFPPVGSRKGLQEDVDTFETILAQCTAFLERSPPPKISSMRAKTPLAPGAKSGTPSTAAAARTAAAAGSASRSSTQLGSTSDQRHRSSRSTATSAEDLPAYNPADFKPGEAYATGSQSSHTGGQIVLVDEEDGSVIGELGDGFQVIEDKALLHGSKEPVEITLPTENVPSIAVAPASADYVDLHPLYKKSKLVSNAAAASRLIVATSEVVSRALQNQADHFAEKAEPTNKPITFRPTTHEHIRRINTLSSGAAGLSAKAVTQVGKVAQNLGAKLAGHHSTSSVDSTASSRRTGIGADGQALENFKPGLLNKSLMAFSTVADGIEQAGRHLMDSSSTAATTVVASKWGDEAGEVTRHLTTGIKNVGLVYIDVTGVSRRAILKSVAKGMVVGHVPGGGDLIVGGGDGGAAVVPAGGRESFGSVTPSSTASATTLSPVLALPNRDRRSGGSTPAARSRSTHDFSDNNPFRGR